MINNSFMIAPPPNGATHVALCNNLRKVAFTLAEVLITLGIIGVVAALTLPTIIQNYQKQVTVNKLKKAYSVLGQVAQRAIADNGSIDLMGGERVDAETTKKFFNTYWLPYFNGVEVFPKNSQHKLNGNTSVYKHLNGVLGSTNIFTNFSAGRIFFSTADGTTYYIDIMRWANVIKNDKGEVISQDPVYNSEQTVIVDLNGIKPPNTLGKDVFMFYTDFSKGIVQPFTGACDAITWSSGCAGKIMQDGWKITYPW